jgi:hypothetical protein
MFDHLIAPEEVGQLRLPYGVGEQGCKGTLKTLSVGISFPKVAIHGGVGPRALGGEV